MHGTLARVMNLRLFAAVVGFVPAAAGAAEVAIVVRDATGAAVQDAVVFAQPRSGPAPRQSREAATIAQRSRQFVPHVTVVQRGTAVTFPNQDDVRHHVYSFSPAKTFEIKLYVGTPAEPVVFDRTGDVVLGCNIHDHMRAFVYVVDTPYFAKSDGEGKALLSGLPAGEYELTAAHYAQAGAAPVQHVRLKADEIAAAAFQVVRRPAPRPAGPK